MTLIVGIRCSDSVVIGTDSAATFGLDSRTPTISQPFQEKIEIIQDHVIIAGTGSIGLGQRFTAIVKNLWMKNILKNKTEVEIGEILSHETLKNFSQTGINPLQPQNGPEVYGALVALPCKRNPALIEFPVVGFQPEIKTDTLWYASMGSGQPVADPLLGFIRTTFWENDSPPSRQEGIFAATMVLTLGFKMVPAGVAGPIQMAILEQTSDTKSQLTARRLTQEELSEHEQSVEDAIEHFRGYREKFGAEDSSTPTLPPAPPSA